MHYPLEVKRWNLVNSCLSSSCLSYLVSTIPCEADHFLFISIFHLLKFRVVMVGFDQHMVEQRRLDTHNLLTGLSHFECEELTPFLFQGCICFPSSVNTFLYSYTLQQELNKKTMKNTCRSRKHQSLANHGALFYWLFNDQPVV